MRLGCTTSTYVKAGVPLEKAFEHLHDLGFHYVDLPGFHKFMPQFLPEREHFRLAKKLDSLDMSAYSTIYLPRNNMGSWDKDERLAAVEECKHSARFIDNMGGKAILLCEAGGRPDYHTDLDKDQAYDNAVDSVKRLCEYCDTHHNGQLILLEIIPYGGAMCSIESMKNFCDKVGAPNLYINVDVGHFNLQKVNGKRFKLAGDRFISVHISDDDNSGIQGCYCEQECLIGGGNTDFKGYFDEIIACNVDANAQKAGLEECYCMIEGGAKNVIPNPDWCIMMARDYVLEHFPFFQNSIY